MILYPDAYYIDVQQHHSSAAEVSNKIEASVLLYGLQQFYKSFILGTT